MHSTRAQNRHRVYIFPRKKVIDIVDRRHAEPRADRFGARTDPIADRYKGSPLNVAAPQQFGMAPSYAPTSEQTESDHANSFFAAEIDGYEQKSAECIETACFYIRHPINQVPWS
jgi:hypothetical protein